MATIEPIYTPENCKFAYQLRWGVTIFWLHPVPESIWIEKLRQALQPDQLRILSWRWLSQDSIQFAISTQPSVSPTFIIQRLKGRLQHAIRELEPKALRPHYSIRSFGTQERILVQAYIAKQPFKHPMATQAAQQIFEDLVCIDPKIDLSAVQKTEHGDYWYNLHLVFVHGERLRDVDLQRLKKTQLVIRRCADLKAWRMSRCAILADHLHLTCGCSMKFSPQDVALSLMNNIAWVYEMKPVLCFSAFLGTFGEYDQRTVHGERLSQGP